MTKEELKALLFLMLTKTLGYNILIKENQVIWLVLKEVKK